MSFGGFNFNLDQKCIREGGHKSTKSAVDYYLKYRNAIYIEFKTKTYHLNELSKELLSNDLPESINTNIIKTNTLQNLKYFLKESVLLIIIIKTMQSANSRRVTG